MCSWIKSVFLFKVLPVKVIKSASGKHFNNRFYINIILFSSRQYCMILPNLILAFRSTPNECLTSCYLRKSLLFLTNHRFLVRQNILNILMMSFRIIPKNIGWVLLLRKRERKGKWKIGKYENMDSRKKGTKNTVDDYKSNYQFKKNERKINTEERGNCLKLNGSRKIIKRLNIRTVRRKIMWALLKMDKEATSSDGPYNKEIDVNTQGPFTQDNIVLR